MDEWNNLKEEVEELIRIKSTPDVVSNSADGLMRKEDFSKLLTVENGATYDIVDIELNGVSTNAVRSSVVGAEIDKLLSKIEDILSEKRGEEALKNLRAAIIRLEDSYTQLFSGVHRASRADTALSLYVFPSRTPNSSEFTFGTDQTTNITMWNSGDNAPLYWTNRAKTTYTSSYGSYVPWSEFTITTNKSEWWYSYNEFESIGASLTALLNSVSLSNMQSIKNSLKTYMSLVKKYAELLKRIFNEFLIGYCTSSSCTPNNCQPFTEHKQNIESVLSVINDLEVFLA